VEQWAEIRRTYFVEGLSLKGIARATGRDRKTIRRASWIRASRPQIREVSGLARKFAHVSSVPEHARSSARLFRKPSGVPSALACAVGFALCRAWSSWRR
jgi:hypothetical protein